MVHVIHLHGLGGADMLRPADIVLPPVGPGQVRLRHRAAGVNFVDIYLRSGTVHSLIDFPAILGVEGAGEIEEIGPNVQDFQVGDRVVWCGPPTGGYAEATVINADRLVRLPDSISFEQAGGAMLRGLTSHMILHRVTHAQAGQTILIHAAAGGLGLVLAQWARHLGLRVLGTVGSDAKADLARAHGVENPIITAREHFVAAVRRLTDGRGADIVVDGIGGQVLTDSLDCLAPFGQLVSVGQAGGDLPTIDIADLGPGRSIALSRPSSFAFTRDRSAYRRALQDMLSLMEQGLSVTIGASFPLAEAAQAHRAMESRQTSGSVILIP